MADKPKTKGLFPGGEVTFKYLFNDDYHPEYINGVVSTTTPRNGLVFHFFFERPGLP